MLNRVELLFSGGRIEKSWIPRKHAVLRNQISVVDKEGHVWSCKVIDICPENSEFLEGDTEYNEIIPF